MYHILKNLNDFYKRYFILLPLHSFYESLDTDNRYIELNENYSE